MSAIYRFGDTHPELLRGLGLRHSHSVATLSRLLRGHRSIENRHFHVKDDSFRADRQVLGHHHSGAVLRPLSNAALGLLPGECQLWGSKEPLTGRSQRLCARPSIVLPSYTRL